LPKRPLLTVVGVSADSWVFTPEMARSFRQERTPEVGCAARIVIVAEADFVASDARKALTVTVPPAGTLIGPVYSPVAETCPTTAFPSVAPLTCQFTAEFWAFCTLAVNCKVLLPSVTLVPGADTLTVATGGGATTLLPHETANAKVNSKDIHGRIWDKRLLRFPCLRNI
jgi:hypothetical protein